MNNTLKQTYQGIQGISLKKYGNIGQKHTNNMENFDVLILANQNILNNNSETSTVKFLNSKKKAEGTLT